MLVDHCPRSALAGGVQGRWRGTPTGRGSAALALWHPPHVLGG